MFKNNLKEDEIEKKRIKKLFKDLRKKSSKNIKLIKINTDNNFINRNLEEDLEIADIIDERKKQDKGIRYTLDDIKKKYNLE